MRAAALTKVCRQTQCSNSVVCLVAWVLTLLYSDPAHTAASRPEFSIQDRSRKLAGETPYVNFFPILGVLISLENLINDGIIQNLCVTVHKHPALVFSFETFLLDALASTDVHVPTKKVTLQSLR